MTDLFRVLASAMLLRTRKLTLLLKGLELLSLKKNFWKINLAIITHNLGVMNGQCLAWNALNKIEMVRTVLSHALYKQSSDLFVNISHDSFSKWDKSYIDSLKSAICG